LIAIGNILALRGQIQIQGKNDRITVGDLCQLITKQVIQNSQNSQENQQSVEAVVKHMSELQYGLDVDCGFTRCDSFTKTEKSKIFDLLGIRMIHGWLVDPADNQLAATIENSMYEELTLKLIASTEEQQDKKGRGKEIHTSRSCDCTTVFGFNCSSTDSSWPWSIAQYIS